MKALVTGAAGQLGRALLALAPAGVQAIGCTRAQLDVCDADSVARQLAAAAPDVVINTAAFTNVDLAEQEPAAAARTNAEGAAILAAACARSGARLVHVSTDFVFAGTQALPYAPADATGPLGVYGATKLEGERRIGALLAGRACVVRTSWLYGAGGSNFVTRILGALGKGTKLRVVVDQVGAPTWTGSLAPAVWQVAARGLDGVRHWCDSGVASRYDFAVAIGEEAIAAGLLRQLPEIEPIFSAQYPQRAARPAYSVLDKQELEGLLNLRAPHWRANLRRMLLALARESQS